MRGGICTEYRTCGYGLLAIGNLGLGSSDSPPGSPARRHQESAGRGLALGLRQGALQHLAPRLALRHYPITLLQLRSVNWGGLSAKAPAPAYLLWVA